MQPLILYEDHELLAINKPAGMLVHGLHASDEQITLVDWFAEHAPDTHNHQWPEPNRPGIVHRLDRDTSGVMLLAKTPEILLSLQQQFADRTTEKTYEALVVGQPSWTDHTVVAPVARYQGTLRKAQYLKLPGDHAKDAETDFHVLALFAEAAHLQVQPKTGRTHQIRVHCGLINHPILGDPWYRTKASRSITKQLAIPRLMLHAANLRFTHPATQETITVSAELPEDFQEILQTLRS